MSSPEHSDSHSSDPKPVSFTVPFILACVFLFIMMLVLSVCDHRKGHGECCEEKEKCTKECMQKCEKGKMEGGKECSKECMEKCEKEGKECKHEECEGHEEGEHGEGDKSKTEQNPGTGHETKSESAEGAKKE